MHDLALLRRQAANGAPEAKLRCALAVLSGQVRPSCIEEAAQLITQAAEQGNADALLLRAALTANGIGLTRSVDNAYADVRHAASRGDPRAQLQLEVLGETAFDREPWMRPIEVEPLAVAPRIFAVQNFIPRAACTWLCERASGQLEPATVLDPRTGGLKRDPIRTNSATAFSLVEPDLVMQLVCRRIAALVSLPPTHQEPTSVLHYAPGQEYRPHYDFVRPWGDEAESFAAEIEAFGQRAATVLIYLNDDYEGGETEFPRLGLRFKGKPGDALLFWNVSPTGDLERDSVHAGLPVTKGEKWLLSKWVRAKPYPLL